MSDQKFYKNIQRFNDIYKLPNNDNPTLLTAQRIAQFKDILSEEVEEAEAIIARYEGKQTGEELSSQARLEVLTDMADWLGDIIVYCASEARRWGLPLPGVLDVIMESNFSKLGADGLPIYDERGKVMKGPHYWKPEPRIRELLSASPSVEEPK